MPHLSKRRVEPEVKKYVLDSFSLLVKNLSTKQEVDEFLSSIISETERLMIAKRIAAAFLLSRGVEEEKISNLIKVTPATVSRLKLWIKTRQHGFDTLFKKLEKERRMTIAKDIFYKLLGYALKASAGIPPKIIRSPW